MNRPRPPDVAPARSASRWWAWWRRWWQQAAPPPAAVSAPGATPAPSPRRRQRERVALLVREVMLRHGVLSSRYRVRVLSLDRVGLQHLVLIDWLPPSQGLAAGPTPEAVRLEAEIRDEAAQTLGLEVRAVYWRGDPQAATRGRRTAAPAGADALSGPRN